MFSFSQTHTPPILTRREEKGKRTHKHRRGEDEEGGGNGEEMEQRRRKRSKIERDGWSGLKKKQKKTIVAVFNRTHCCFLSHLFNIVHKECLSVALPLTGSWHIAPVKQALCDCSKKPQLHPLYCCVCNKNEWIKMKDWKDEKKKRRFLPFDR